MKAHARDSQAGSALIFAVAVAGVLASLATAYVVTAVTQSRKAAVAVERAALPTSRLEVADD